MTTREFLRALRRRLPIVILAVLAGVAVGWFTAPQAHRLTVYSATHTLMFDAQSAGASGYTIDQLALLATSGPVPTRVAEQLHMSRDRVRSMVTATSDAQVAVISISGRSANPAQAKALADATASDLSAEMVNRQNASYQLAVSRLSDAVNADKSRISQLRATAAAGGGADPQLTNQQLAEAQANLAADQQSLQALSAPSPESSGLTTLEMAVAEPVSATGIHLAATKPGRGLLLGGFGLLFGIGAVVAVDRVDNRVRTKRTAEQASGIPVVGEVPPLPRKAGQRLLTTAQPGSPFVEAYRGLRTMVSLWAADKDETGGRVIVVTSAMAGEGKTTTVAHLGALLAEVGHSVLTISADFHSPQLHRYFDRPQGPGLVDVLKDGPDSFGLADLDLSTPVAGVSLLASGTSIENPAPLLEHVGDLLRAARSLCDFVLVDSPPLLMVSDTAELIRHADGVLVVTRAGRTPIDASVRAAELLNRLKVPVVGTALVGSQSAGSHHYYRYGYPYRKPYNASPQFSDIGAPPSIEVRSVDGSSVRPER